MKTIAIPKEIFENIFFAEGGEKKNLNKALTGEYQFALDAKEPITEPNAEIEGGEYIQDSQGIRKAEGKSHETGGMPVKLEDGTRIVSNHLQIGIPLAKHLKELAELDVKATDTYSKVLDKYTKKIGLQEINDNLEKNIGLMEKEKKTDKHKDTELLNEQYISKQINNLTKEKEPLEKQREELFNMLFDVQESTKTPQQGENFKMEYGGEVGEVANKYGISQERAHELLNLQKFQNGAQYLQGDLNLDGVVDAKDNYYNDYNQLYNTNRDLIVRSTDRTDFTKNPRTVYTLPYTPRDVSSNPIWKGDSYDKAWKPLVAASMADESKAKAIDEWLTKNKDKYSPNIQQQLAGLTGKARMKRIQELATDYKPGPFHNALLQAMAETTEPKKEEPATPAEATPAEPLALGKRTQWGALSLPQRIPNLPTLQSPLKFETRYNRKEATHISPTEQLTEADRMNQAVMNQMSNNLSGSDLALAGIGMAGNAAANRNKVISETNRYNAAADERTADYNNQIGDREQDAQNNNAGKYQELYMRGIANYENDLNNMYNRDFEDQVNNWKTVNTANWANAMNPQAQNTGYGYVANWEPDTSESKVVKDLQNTESIKNQTARKAKGISTKPVSKFGGRFKKK
jgi:hypothetical protein